MQLGGSDFRAQMAISFLPEVTSVSIAGTFKTRESGVLVNHLHLIKPNSRSPDSQFAKQFIISGDNEIPWKEAKLPFDKIS